MAVVLVVAAMVMGGGGYWMGTSSFGRVAGILHAALFAAAAMAWTALLF